MNAQQRWWLRLGVLTELVERSSSGMGRTAVMKLAFLLQTVKGVPLGYNFRLYTYGPYENDVLHDLGQAESMRAVESKIVAYPSGSGYVFSPGPESGKIKAMASPELSRYEDAIVWAVSEFGHRTASDLELLSTIVYVDQDALERRQQISSADLCRQVQEIKPRFSEASVQQKIAFLDEKGLLLALSGDFASNRPH